MEITKEEIRKARNEYHRQWRAKNPEKVKKHRETFFARQAKQMKQEQQEQQDECNA